MSCRFRPPHRARAEIRAGIALRAAGRLVRHQGQGVAGDPRPAGHLPAGGTEPEHPPGGGYPLPCRGVFVHPQPAPSPDEGRYRDEPRGAEPELPGGEGPGTRVPPGCITTCRRRPAPRSGPGAIPRGRGFRGRGPPGAGAEPESPDGDPARHRAGLAGRGRAIVGQPVQRAGEEGPRPGVVRMSQGRPGQDRHRPGRRGRGGRVQGRLQGVRGSAGPGDGGERQQEGARHGQQPESRRSGPRPAAHAHPSRRWDSRPFSRSMAFDRTCEIRDSVTPRISAISRSFRSSK